MLDRDDANPFIADQDAAGAVHTLVDNLVLCCAYTGPVNPSESAHYVSMALASAAQATETGDVVQTLHGVLFEVARYICLHLPEGIAVQEINNPAELDPTGKDPRVVVMAAGMEWFKAVAARQRETSENVLKALHKEIPRNFLPSAYLNVAAGAVVSLGVSLQASAHGPDCSCAE